jgi:hydroxyethylthiazole kinase
VGLAGRSDLSSRRRREEDVDRPTDDAGSWTARTAELLDRVRTRGPQVHVLTSTVAQPLAANLLLAAGAQPSMSAAPGEIEAFAERADALVANLGMLDETRRGALTRALPVVGRRGVPWVLDPVKVERSPDRLAFARELLAFAPAVVRANRAEMEALRLGDGPVRATTGEVDLVETGGRKLRIGGGDPLMTHVTAMGCAGTGLVAAFLAVEPDPFAATVGALACLKVAGEMAGEDARGPGSFPAALLDALYALDAELLATRAKLA